MGQIKGRDQLVLIAIVALALFLRLWGIDQSFWLDEASQAQLSSLSLSQIWSGRPADFHPPLFYLLAHFWLTLGRSEAWLRLLPVSLGVLAIGLMYRLASELLPARVKFWSWQISAAQVAAFLLAINPFHIYYSQEFRMYSLLALGGIWAMYLFLRRSRWLFVALAMLLYTHYASVLLLVSLFIYVWIFEKDRLRFCTWHLALSTLLYLPWWPQFLRQLNSGVNIDVYLPGWRGLLALGPVRAIPLTLFKLTAGRIDFVSPIVYSLYLGYTLFLLLLCVMWAKLRRVFLLVWLLVPQVLAVLASFVVPFNQPFRLIFILPALILLLSQGVVRFPRLVLLLVIYISVTGVVMYSTRPRLQREQWRQASNYLSAAASPDSTVVVKFSDRFAPLIWYAPFLKVVGAVPTYPAKQAEVQARLGSPLSGVSRVYLLDYLGTLTDPYQVVEQSLAQLGWARDSTANFEGVGFIHSYSK